MYQNTLLVQVLLSQWNYSGIWSELIKILTGVNRVSTTDFKTQEKRPLKNHWSVKNSQEEITKGKEQCSLTSSIKRKSSYLEHLLFSCLYTTKKSTAYLLQGNSTAKWKKYDRAVNKVAQICTYRFFLNWMEPVSCCVLLWEFQSELCLGIDLILFIFSLFR